MMTGRRQDINFDNASIHFGQSVVIVKREVNCNSIFARGVNEGGNDHPEVMRKACQRFECENLLILEFPGCMVPNSDD